MFIYVVNSVFFKYRRVIFNFKTHTVFDRMSAPSQKSASPPLNEDFLMSAPPLPKGGTHSDKQLEISFKTPFSLLMHVSFSSFSVEEKFG